MRTTLAPELVERLRAEEIDPDLVAALVDRGDARVVDDQSFEIPVKRPDRSVATIHWTVGDEAEPWSGGGRFLWWPVGRGGSTAIVVVGVSAGLAVASVTHRADADGAIWPRPLRGVLADATPVVLPAGCFRFPLEWLDDEGAPAQLVAELEDAGVTLLFLALPAKEPGGLVEAEPIMDAFLDGVLNAASTAPLTAVVVPLAADLGLPGVLADFRPGPARQIALASVLTFWRKMAQYAPGGDQ